MLTHGGTGSRCLSSFVLLAIATSAVPSAEVSAQQTTPTVVAEQAIQPHMAVDHQGNVYLAFIHRGNISVSISGDGGKTFQNPIVAIDVQGRARGGAQRGPRIGVDAKQNITVTAPVTFDESEYRKRYPTAELYLVRSTDGGTTWTQPVQVNEVAKQAPEALHWMTVAAGGDVHVAWLDRRERSGPGQDVFYASVQGGRVGANRKVANTVCECCAPGLAVDAAGNPLVAFREGGDKSSREIFATWSNNGGQSFAPLVRVNKENTLEDG